MRAKKSIIFRFFNRVCLCNKYVYFSFMRSKLAFGILNLYIISNFNCFIMLILFILFLLIYFIIEFSDCLVQKKQKSIIFLFFLLCLFV